MQTTDPKRPDYCRPETAMIADDLALIDDLLGGTSQMHRKATTWIRKWTDEDPKVYKLRRTIEEVFEGLPRTLSAGVGMMFQNAPQLTANGVAEMESDWENIDGQGTDGDVFLKRFSDRAMAKGLGAILVDHPPPPVDQDGKPVTITGDNEAQFNLRPKWAGYSRQHVINWRTAVVNNQTVFTMVVLYEPGEQADGEYGISPVERFRVCTLESGEGGKPVARWRLHRLLKIDGKETFVVEKFGDFKNKNGELAGFIPCAIAYTGRTEGIMDATVPLAGVAWANLGHWRQSSNLRFYREVAAFPMLKLVGKMASEQIGEKTLPSKMKIGPLALAKLNDGSSLEWLELAGSSMEQLEKGIREKLEQMARMGFAFLFGEQQTPETATAARLDATAENATLGTAVQGIEDAANLALQYHAWFRGVAKEQAPTIALSREFQTPEMSAQEMMAWATVFEKTGLARALVEAFVRGKKLRADTDVEDTVDEIEQTARAANEMKRLEDEARAAEFAANGGAPNPAPIAA